ncbi:MAG: SDR family oxidoreductase [Betaproteobacteria bacterium]|nr:SDR family oxidoreductase [Betaproteobacteria bacterium]
MSENKRVAIITGSSSGIGAATALELSRRGWRVVINYSKSAEKARKIAAQCAESISVQADVSLDDDCRRLAQAALDKWGRIDALVNNAGSTKFVPHAKLDDLSAEDFQRIYSTNVVSAFQMARACAPALKASGKGAIVNVSSIAAQWGTGSSIAYAASKGGLNSMTYSLARVLGPEVRVNAVMPGFVETPWQTEGHGAERAAELAKRYATSNVLQATCSAEDVADSIVWLIEGAPKTTGETIFIDGGTHIGAVR